ncbi:putative serine/threonine protein kinase [Trypanosoma rangeli]|uniref:non-specific serine/threonine protein kinase n=1 Tax=Trypanosoma rangeli TaxID=5698 RepID=A0A422N3T6_TRYRA|nr:putative serine/threonine protein kinase [Trypanosoma rangeli]RNF00092.1 putative serine/threonine protein kinase [Trypanosoma rangeli]|eukprot:RNF00092.1 putative serine/threonine protein kinase [Trypanosoma rangeli]
MPASASSSSERSWPRWRRGVVGSAPSSVRGASPGAYSQQRGAGRYDQCTPPCKNDGGPVSQWDRFPCSHQIGSGSFGNVFLCHDMLPGSMWYRKPVAVKAMLLETLSDSSVVLIMNEVAILRHLRHPHILRYVDSFIDEDKQLCLVAEYAEGGELTSLLRRPTELDGGGDSRLSHQSPSLEEGVIDDGHGWNQPAALASGVMQSQTPWLTGFTLGGTHEGKAAPLQAWIESYRIADIVRQCLEALSYLHQNYIIHRDIKPANVYLSKGGTVKLGDFGASKLLSLTDPFANTFIGTPFYLCPELCLGEPYSFGADIWALGVLTYEMYCKKLPFVADNVLAQIHVITEGEYDREALHRPHVFTAPELQSLEALYGSAFTQQEKSLHTLVVALVERMLVVDALERPSALQLLREFFFADPLSGSMSTGSQLPSRESLFHVDSSRMRRSISQSSTPRPRTSTTENTSGTTTTTTEAAALLVRCVSQSYEALLEHLPNERRNDVLQAASRSVSPICYAWPSASVLQGNRDAVDLGEAPHSDTCQMTLSEMMGKIPWLRHAEAFSSLSLLEGQDDDVVRVDWMDNEHFSLVTPHQRRRLLSSPCPVYDGEGGVCSLETREATPTAGHKVAGGSKDEAETQVPAIPSVQVVGVVEELQRPPILAERFASLNDNPVEEGEQQRQRQPGGVGRCQGLSTEVLEAMLRRKIMASQAHRQLRLKAMREAHALRDKENLRLQAELNELYAKSFSEKRMQMIAHGEESEMNTTMKLPETFASTQRPRSTAADAVGAVAASTVEGEFAKTAGLERTLNRLAATSNASMQSHHGGNSTLLANEVVRLALDAAAVAERCAKWTMRPPARLDFSKYPVDEVDRRSTSSVADTERGINTKVYDTPVTLCIVRNETYITRVDTPSAPSGADDAAGALLLPMTVTLKPIRRRTRLDGIVWRVKLALKAYGLDYVLLFPLDIDDVEEVDAEELGLRYLDCVGDVVVISEASEWSYVRRDWYQRKNLPWMQLYMVMQ